MNNRIFESVLRRRVRCRLYRARLNAEILEMVDAEDEKDDLIPRYLEQMERWRNILAAADDDEIDRQIDELDQLWYRMSTEQQAEVRRLGAQLNAKDDNSI